MITMTTTTLISIGELLVEFVSHRKGCELSQLGEYSGPYPSGAPAIFADQAARCGARSRLIGSLGQDGFGKILNQRLVMDGVDTQAIQHCKDKTTGVAFVSYKPDGSRNFIFHLNNTAADSLCFSEQQLPEGELVLHVSGSSLGNPQLRVQIRNAVAAVLRRGGKISCDPNARPELMQNSEVSDCLKEIISQSSYLLPSSADIEFLYPELSESEAISQLQHSGAELIALKRGDQGVTLISPQGRFDLPPYRVSETDPTGAGDCFCATFLACLIQGKSALESCRFANAAGALSVTRRGPMEGNSNLGQIEAFISSQQQPPQTVQTQDQSHDDQ